MIKTHFFEKEGDLVGIEEKRREKNLTQKELGEIVGVDQSSIHLWESGKTMPRAQMLLKLAKVFQCSIDELLSKERE